MCLHTDATEAGISKARCRGYGPSMDSHSFWRPMVPEDLPVVCSMASDVHPAFPEDAAVFAERLAIYPAGSRLLMQGKEPAGYLISHPWRSEQPPALNTMLQGLPVQADTYYLHDLALLSGARGTGAARAVVEWTADHARCSGHATLSLIAVNGSEPFWTHLGFRVETGRDDQLRTYGNDARFMVRKLG